MGPEKVAPLLQPFIGEHLAPSLAQQLSQYLDLLLRWNARVNLTAVRRPEEMVTRHFGESLFAARVLFGAGEGEGAGGMQTPLRLADVGSGAGFPGIPIKLLAAQTRLTLIESQGKKATFLRELVRTLGLQDVEVFAGRAEDWGKTAEIVTLRAVERFTQVLPTAAKLVAPQGRLCLLIGREQIVSARKTLGDAWDWRTPELIPLSTDRVVIIAGRN